METATFLEEIAKALAEEFALSDEDLLLALLKKCKVAGSPTSDQIRLLGAVNDSYVEVIKSVERYFSPNIVQALKASNSTDKTLELLKDTDFSNLIELENFFSSELVNVPLITNTGVHSLVNSGIRYLDAHSAEFIQRGFFFNEPDGLGFIFKALGIPIGNEMGKHSGLTRFYRKRADKMGNVFFKDELSHAEFIKKDIKIFSTSLNLNERKKESHTLSLSEPWFIEEEKALRERCLLFFKRTLKLLEDFYIDPNIQILDRYKNALLKSFSIQELELLMGHSTNYFSWSADQKAPRNFSYELFFIRQTLKTFALIEAEAKNQHIKVIINKLDELYVFQPIELPGEVVDNVSFLRPHIFNLYEALLLIKDFKKIEEGFLEFKKLKPLMNKAQVAADRYIASVKKSFLNKRITSDRNPADKIPSSKKSQRPLPGFNSDFTIFYPASKLQDPIKLSKKQALVAQIIHDEQIRNGTISKRELFNNLYPDLYNSTKGGNAPSKAIYDKKLKNFRLDTYCFKTGKAWKLGLIKNTNRSGMIEAQYFIDENYYKKKRGRPSKKKSKNSKRKK